MCSTSLQQVDSMSLIEGIELKSVTTTLQKVRAMQAVIKSTLTAEHDYGVIPGTSKPTLLKPGAEKILMVFGLTSEYDFLDKIEDYDKGFFSYSMKCILSKNGVKITEGVGQANTYEGKHRWRWIKESDIPPTMAKETLVSRQNKWGKTEYKMENDDPYTLCNTVLKMAKKRAQIDAVLTVASLSELFTQDIEDMKEFIQSEQVDTMTVQEAAAVKITFGKHKGSTLGDLYKEQKDYFDWLMGSEKTDAVIKQAGSLLLAAVAEKGERKAKKAEKPKEEIPDEIADAYRQEIESNTEELPY